MKQKLQKIFSNAWLWIILWVIILWFGSIFFVLGSRLEKIFSYIPENVNQVFVIKVNDTNNALYKNYSQQIAGAFQETLKQIEIAVIAQKTVDTIQENLIFIQAKTDFNPQTLLDAINSDAEVQYIYQKLDSSLYVFGKPETLKYVTLDPTNNFFAYAKLQAFKKLLKHSDISFFSRVDNTLDVAQVSPFLANLDCFVYGLDTRDNKISMEANLVYKNARQTEWDYSFTPILESYLNDKSLLFVELGSVVQQLGIKKEDFMSVLSSFLTSQKLTGFTDQEYEAFYESLDTNIGIGIGEWNNLLGIGMFLIFKNPDLFAVVSKLVPTIYQQLLTIPVMSGFDISLVQEANKQWFSSLVGGVQEVGLYTQKDKDSTLITLGDPQIDSEINSEWTIKMDYTKNSLGYFYANFDNILTLYKKFAGSLSSWQMDDQFTFFEHKILKGQIIPQSDKIVVKAVIE